MVQPKRITGVRVKTGALLLCCQSTIMALYPAALQSKFDLASCNIKSVEKTQHQQLRKYDAFIKSSTKHTRMDKDSPTGNIPVWETDLNI